VLSDRTISCIISLGYDREVEDVDERAKECYHQLLGSLARNGYYSYRLSIGSMNRMGDKSSEYLKFLQNLKALLDPGGILSPGRYIPERASTSVPIQRIWY
jgi:4-cresol dehydrogenase (hydroxylating)